MVLPAGMLHLHLSLLLFLLIRLPFAHPQAVVSVPTPWSYDDSSPRGPSHWSTLDTPAPLCSSGQSQSPIDLPLAFPPSSPSPLAIHWDDLHSSVSSAASTPSNTSASSLHTVVNTGHSIQVKFDPTTASHVTFRSTPYSLVQFHFHAPSEHTIASHHHDMELHLVHASADGQLLVVGVLIDADPNEEEEERERRAAGQGAGNSTSDFLRALAWSNLPSSSLSSGRPSSKPLLHLLSSTLSSSHSPTFYAYSGSLTTPPCSEGVQWFVATEPLHISTSELAVYSQLFHHTARPTQPLHSRAVSLVTTPSAHPIAFALVVLGLLVFAGVVGAVWGCVRLFHHDTLEDVLTASVQENVDRDKQSDKQWMRERVDTGVGGRGGGQRPIRRSSGAHLAAGGREEEDTAPLLPASFPSSSMAKINTSPLSTVLRRATNGKGGSNGNLADAWKSGGGAEG